MIKSYIIVNATALDQSGGLTVLKQFISNIKDDQFNYIVFVSDRISIVSELPNLEVIPISNKAFIKRFIWDAIGLQKWLDKRKITPFASISLQNTNFRLRNKILNFVYFHQAIPFVNVKWSVFKSIERKLWFYKNIYPFFVRLFINDRTRVIVQTNSIRDLFCEKFTVSKDRIIVIEPVFKEFDESIVEFPVVDESKFNIFYPATAFIYKNHKVILEALNNLAKKNRNCTVTLYLTCKQHELEEICTLNNYGFELVFLGSIKFEQVQGYYRKCDLLVFPSYIETVGLPLLEAAYSGISILASDLPYSREIVGEYSGAKFVKYNDINCWQSEIEEVLLKKGIRYSPFSKKNTSSWCDLFKIIQSNL